MIGLRSPFCPIPVGFGKGHGTQRRTARRYGNARSDAYSRFGVRHGGDHRSSAGLWNEPIDRIELYGGGSRPQHRDDSSKYGGDSKHGDRAGSFAGGDSKHGNRTGSFAGGDPKHRDANSGDRGDPKHGDTAGSNYGDDNSVDVNACARNSHRAVYDGSIDKRTDDDYDHYNDVSRGGFL